jgi:hypothetical protein
VSCFVEEAALELLIHRVAGSPEEAVAMARAIQRAAELVRRVKERPTGPELRVALGLEGDESPDELAANAGRIARAMILRLGLDRDASPEELEGRLWERFLMQQRCGPVLLNELCEWYLAADDDDSCTSEGTVTTS